MLNFILIYFSINLHFCLANSIHNFAEISSVKKIHSLALCICEVGKRDFFWNPTFVMKVTENQTKSESEFIAEIVEVFTTQSRPYFTMENSDNETFDINQGNYFYVEYFDTSNILFDYDFGVIQKKIKYIWVLENYFKDFWADEDFLRIGGLLGKHDVLFFLTATELDYKMIAFLPDMDETTCTVTFNPVQINTCHDGILITPDTFPLKTPSNLKKCQLKVGLGTLYPLSMIDNRESLQTYDSLKGVSIKGTDVEIVKIVSDYSNATLDLYYIFIYAENTYRYQHYLPLLLNGSLDVCAGGMYRIFGDQVEYSGVYARQVVKWIYTADRSPLTWQNLIVKIDGLYLFMIFYLVFSVAWYHVCVFDENAIAMRDTMFYSWGALIGGASLPDARTLKQKMLSFSFLYMCLHLSFYISTQLYSYLTIRGPAETLRSNDDVMKSGRTLFLNTANRYFVRDKKYETFANTSLECDTFLNCTLATLEQKGLTIIIESYLYQFQDTVDTMVNDEAKILMPNENLLTVYHEMIIWKDSPIVDILQKVIKRLFEAGITLRLFTNAIGITRVDKAARATRNILSPEYSCQEGCPITFAQVSGALYLWASGCGLAIGVFVIELFYVGRVLVTPYYRQHF